MDTLEWNLDEKGGYTPYIKVAVIDNGVDPGSIDCRGVSGASFVPSGTGESNWWYVKHPHGTSMARVISEINPHCRLLVAKVGDTRTDFTATRLIKAIKWAVDAGADVISMSLSLDSEDTGLDISINEASKEGVVILASINGEGANAKTSAFPASHPNVIAIGSADSQGSPSRGTVDGEAEFLLPGEHIIAHAEFLNGLADASEISGPSVATAIASGLASLVLACDRFALHSQAKDEADWLNHQRLRHKVVRTMFARMTQKSRMYVQPERLFVEDKLQPAWGEGDSVLRWIDDTMENVLK
jgi:subtilisin family serine protease